MAAVSFGQAYWPECTDFISCSYTVGHGIAPGQVTLVIPENQIALAQISGDLTITDDIQVFKLKNCKLSDLQYVGIGSNGGRTFQLTILDRRWKWAFGAISGAYNHRDDKGQVKPWMKEHLVDLARKCLIAMGEGPGGIGDLPEPENEQDLPEINWVAANPAQALAELIEPFGCVLVFRPIANDVVIRRIGEGLPLPDLDVESYTPTLDLPETPARVTVVGSEIAYTGAFLLEAVGQEPSGKILPIDDLSYKPANGWGTTSPPNFGNLTVPDANPGIGIFFPGIKIAALTRKEYEELARKCIYRWYRITLLSPTGRGDWTAPGLDNRTFSTIEEIRLLPGIFTTRRDEEGDVYVEPPRVYGVRFRGAVNQWANSAKNESCSEKFTIDQERGLVMFERYMYRTNPTAQALAAQIAGAAAVNGNVSSFKLGPAELVLVTSFFARDTHNHQFDRAHRTLDLGVGIGGDGIRTGDRILRHDEIRLVHYAEFDPSTWVAKNKETNRDNFNKAADYYLKAAKREYERVGVGNARYPGILAVDPDGALSQITWEMGGGGGCFTTISRNSEHAYWLPTYKQQRGGQRMKIIMDLQPQPAAAGPPTSTLRGGRP